MSDLDTGTGFEYDVFLSYSSKDREQVLPVAKRLRAAGLQIWFDQWVMKPGDDIYLSISRGLEAARKGMLFLSPAAVGADWPMLEQSTMAFCNRQSGDRSVIPVLVANCDIPFALQRFKYVDLRQPSQAAYRELIQACQPNTIAKPQAGLVKLGGPAAPVPQSPIAKPPSGRVKPIRVLLADDHPIVRAGIRNALNELPGVEVVGEASDGREAIELVKSHQPDMVFMDISMPGLNGLEATERIVKAFPQVRVIILSRHTHEEYYWRALQVGASGYLLKHAAIEELKAALQRVTGGEIYLSRELSTRLRNQLPLQRIAHAHSPVEQLTARQREILQLIAEGHTAKAIALILKISVKTVEYHRAKLMQQLNIFDVPGLARFALRAGLISQES